MTQEGTTRKLAAILSADVKEYSRLMSQDERGTIRILTSYKEAMSSLIHAFLKGRFHYLRFTPEDLVDAIRYFKWAFELDSNHGEAYAGLANTFWLGSGRRWHLGVARTEARLLGREYLETAMKFDNGGLTNVS